MTSMTPSVYSTRTSPGRTEAAPGAKVAASHMPSAGPPLASTSRAPEARSSKGGLCPQFAKPMAPVTGLEQAVEGRDEAGGVHRVEQDAVEPAAIASRVMPLTRWARSAALNVAMMSAAGTPFPDTSAIATPRRPSGCGRKS